MATMVLRSVVRQLVICVSVLLLFATQQLEAFWFERGARSASSSAQGSRTINILDFGAKPTKSDSATALANTNAINRALNNLTNGDTFLVPVNLEFYAVGGIQGSNLTDVFFHFNGTIRALPDLDNWPKNSADHVDGAGDYVNFFTLYNCSHVTIQGAPGMMIDGMGKKWWNAMILGTLKGKRPKLLDIDSSKNVLVQDMVLHSSPSFHLIMRGVAEVEVRNITILTDRKDVIEAKQLLKRRRYLNDATRAQPSQLLFGGEPGLEPQDLNTDGIDPSGRDVWVHHCSILNDDDSIAVKPCCGNDLSTHDSCAFSACSENMLFEDLVLTGFGASIGSVPPNEFVNCVRNITFRRISMPRTGKGIYVKSNPSCQENHTAIIEDITYEDINIINASWWPIWIGPQQQHEPGSQLEDKCALIYPIDPHCPTQGCVTFSNITLRNIYIENPLLSPGVILGNKTNPMQNISFINVTVDNPGEFPFHKEYQCENVDMHFSDTSPEPQCS